MKKKNIYLAIGIVIVAILWASLSFWEKLSRPYEGETAVWLKIPPESSQAQIHDSLRSVFGTEYGDNVAELWKILKGKESLAPGAYRFQPGTKAIDIAKAIRSGNQTPVKVTFNNVRLLHELAQKLEAQLNFSEAEFMAACDSVLGGRGIPKNQYIAYFLPDTYEFYWLTSPNKVVERLASYHDSFWNETRLKKAATLKLNPVQVATLASIVEEETAAPEEKGTVARLYLNRLSKGMKLQADPTVKFAVGDFSLRRILKKHLEKDSPYNTYIVNGLPPGPIRMAAGSTIDDVLNAPANNYLYMCAKEDFSGRHNFAVGLAEHNANAERYRAALNARGIR